MADDLETYHGEGDSSILNEHKSHCICCGGRTYPNSNSELAEEEYSKVYQCQVCDTQVAHNNSNEVRLRVEPRRFNFVVSDEFSSYNWD